MLPFLKNHPFAVEAFFEKSIVLTFAIKKEQIEDLIPDCLVLDTWQDKWAFFALALVQTKGLRPKGSPAFLGKDFFLAGYRLFVRYTNNEGRRLRGLYILKSETDKKEMTFWGNLFTHYNYTTTDVALTEKDGITEIKSITSGIHLNIDMNEKDVAIPSHSPFADWKEARRFAGPLPFTFTVLPDKKEVLIIEGVRQHWEPRPLKVNNFQIDFMNQPALLGAVLANAFVVEQVPYFWRKGKIETWSH